MYLLDVPPVAYVDPWLSTFEQQFSRLSRDARRRIAYYYDRPDNSTFRYRVYNMIQTFEGSDLPVAAGYFTYEDLDHVGDVLALADVLVICRAKYSHKLNHMIVRAKNKGIPVLYDVDDFVFDVNAVHLVLDTLGQPRNDADWDFWFAYFARNGAALKLCDGAVTTNAFLAQRLHEFTGKPVDVIPNFINREQLAISERIYQQKQTLRFARDGRIHAGYFSGSPSHRKDLDVVLDALAGLLDAYPQLVVRIVGFIDLPPALARCGARVEQLPFTDFINLQRLVGETEINLAPVQDNEFTNCKSQLKYFEAGIVGTTTVASPIFTYRNAITHGENGWLANSYQWSEVVGGVIDSLGKPALERVIEQARRHSLQEFAWYNQINRLAQIYL